MGALDGVAVEQGGQGESRTGVVPGDSRSGLDCEDTTE